MREREREKERASERDRKRASERERKRASENEIEIECEREEATSDNAWVTPPSVSPVPHAHVYNPGAHNWCRAYVWVTPPSASASHCKRARPRKRTHGQSPCLRTSSRHWQTALWLGPAVSPVALSLHTIVGAFDDDLGPQVFLKFKHVDFFSLPSFVSRSSTHFSQLISQIGPHWPKSGWHEEHSEVLTEKPSIFRTNYTEPSTFRTN